MIRHAKPYRTPPPVIFAKPPAFTPVVIEDQTGPGGVEWGVSLTSHNPEPHDYLACANEDEAWRLAEVLKALRCPKCGRPEIIMPSSGFPRFMCDPCATDFGVAEILRDAKAAR